MFSTQLKQTIITAITNELWKDAEALISQMFNTNINIDSELLYLASIVAENKGLYGLTRYFLERAHALSNDENIANALNAFSAKDIDFDCSKDYTAQNGKRSILLISGEQDILDYFIEDFENALMLLGHNVCNVNLRNGINHKELLSFFNNKVDFIITFNNSFTKLKINEVFMADKLGSKVINIIVDHPAYYIKELLSIPKNLNVHHYCIDKNHVKYLDNHSGIYSKNSFLPHGGRTLNLELKALKDRPFDVLYVGGAKNNRNNTLPEFVNKFIDLLIQNPNLDSTAIINSLKDEMDLSENDMDSLATFEMRALSYYRVKMVQILVEAGIDVTVYGDDWDKTTFAQNPHLHYGGKLTSKEALKAIYNTKIVLNSMPWFKDGSHERLFNGMLAKSIILTDKSKWIEDEFTNGKEMLIIDLEKLELMPNIVQDVLTNLDKYQKIADTGYECAISKHTWSHRLMKILDDSDEFNIPTA